MPDSQRSAFSATSLQDLLGRHDQFSDSGGYGSLYGSASSAASQSDAGGIIAHHSMSQDSNEFRKRFSTTASISAQHRMQDSTKPIFGQPFLWFGATFTLALSGISAVAHHLTKATKWELTSYTLLLLAEIYVLVIPTFQSCGCVLKSRVCFLVLNFLSLLLCPTAWVFWHFELDSWTHLSIRTSEIVLTFAVVQLAIAASTNPISKSFHATRDLDQVSAKAGLHQSVQLADWVGTTHRHEIIALQSRLLAPQIQEEAVIEIDQE